MTRPIAFHALSFPLQTSVSSVQGELGEAIPASRVVFTPHWAWNRKGEVLFSKVVPLPSNRSAA